MRTGYCGTGCPIDAKQSAALTYLPDAIAAGAVVYANTKAERIEWSGAARARWWAWSRTTGPPS